MRLSLDNAYKKLHSLFNDHQELDTASVMVMWGDYIRDYEKEQIVNSQRAISQLYALIHGTHEPYAENDSNVYVQDAKYRISREKLGDFCKSKGLNKEKVLDVLEGRTFEYEGYRQGWFNGCLNVMYKEPKVLEPDEVTEHEYKVRVPKHAKFVNVVDTETWE